MEIYPTFKRMKTSFETVEKSKEHYSSWNKLDLDGKVLSNPTVMMNVTFLLCDETPCPRQLIKESI